MVEESRIKKTGPPGYEQKAAGSGGFLKVRPHIRPKKSTGGRPEKPRPAETSADGAPPDGPSFGSVLELWLRKMRIGSKQSTVSAYTTIVMSHIYPVLGGLPSSQITPGRVVDFITDKMEHGRLDGKGKLAPSTVRNILSVLNSALSFAGQEGYIEKNASVQTGPKIRSEEARVLSDAEQLRLETFLCEHTDLQKLGILICLYTGMRLGEICALKWDAVDLREDTISVRRTIQRIKNCDGGAQKTKIIFDTPKSRSSMRKIPISSFLSGMLKRYVRPDDCFVLTGSPDEFVEPRTYQYRYRQLLSRAGIAHIKFHALRHTFATRCVRLGFDVKTLSEILGHASASVTLNTYVHPSFDLMRASMERLVPEIPADRRRPRDNACAG